MEENPQERRANIILSGTGRAERFPSTASFPRERALPERDRRAHGPLLRILA